MSTRKLLLILVPAAALLIFALLHFVRDGESVSGAPTAHLVGEERAAAPASGSVLPGNLADGAPRVEQLPVGDAGASAAAPPPPAVPGSIAGRVVDAAGHAIAGEPVFLTLTHDAWEPNSNPHEQDDDQPEPVIASAVSDAQGAFAFTARAGVRHTLHAGGGHWPRLAIEDVRCGDHLLVTLPDGYALTGTVVAAETHEPVVGAQVMAVADDNHLLGKSGADGSFNLGPLPAQDVFLGGYAPGFDITLKAEIAPALGPVTLELPPGRAIHGRVVDKETGAMLTVGGEVALQLDTLAVISGGKDPLPGNHLIEEQKTPIDATGMFAFAAGPSFGFSMVASAPGYAPTLYDRYENRTLGSDDEIVIPLRPLAPLAGKAVLDDGGAAPGADVTASDAKGQFAAGKSDNDGAFSLQPKDWDGQNPVFVTAKDSQGRSGRLAADDPSQALVVVLVPPLHVTVQVIAGGAPVAGAEVAALSDGTETSETRTGVDGTADLVHPLAGPDVVAVRLQARYADSQSLPLIIDPKQPHADKIVLDLDSGGVVTGLVLDRNGAPVPSALVRLAPDNKVSPDVAPQLVKLGLVESTIDFGDKPPTPPPQITHTDLNGNFRLAGVIPDVAYRLRVRVDGFRDNILTPVFADPKPLTLVLDPVVLWEGRLADASTGLPVQQFVGALLQESKNNKGEVVFRPTKQRVTRKPDAPGEFSVELPEPGRFQLRLLSQDMIPALSTPVDFDGATPPPFAALAIWPAAVLEVTVQDGRGRAVPGYAVAVIPWDASKDAETPSGDVRKQGQTLRTDDAGLVRFNLGEGGSYRIGGGPGQWLDGGPVAVKPGTPVARLYRLPPTGDLEITITDELGAPLPGVRVELRSSADEKLQSISRMAATHGVDGIVHFESLPPGAYDLTLRRRNYQTERRQNFPVHGNVIERLSVSMTPTPKDATPPKGSGGAPKGGGQPPKMGGG